MFQKTSAKFAKRLTNTRSLIIKIAVKSIERRRKEKDKNCRIPVTRRWKFTTSLIPLVNHVSYGSKCIVVNGISGKKLWTLVGYEQALVFAFRDEFRVDVHARRGGREDRNGEGWGRRGVKVTEKP